MKIQPVKTAETLDFGVFHSWTHILVETWSDWNWFGEQIRLRHPREGMFFKYEPVAMVSQQGTAGLCSPSRCMRFAQKLMMCASPCVSHAVLIALQGGDWTNLTAAGLNVFLFFLDQCVNVIVSHLTRCEKPAGGDAQYVGRSLGNILQLEMHFIRECGLL